MKKAVLTLLFCLAALAPFPTAARPFTPEDRGYDILEIGQDIKTYADGRQDIRLSYRYRILTEFGLQSFNIYHIPYNANTQTVTIERVEVINPEGTTPVDPKNIEEKSLFGGISGFDETKTKVIALPNVKIGSEIRIAYAFSVFHPPFKDSLSDRFMLYFDSPVRAFRFKLSAPPGAALFLNDPSGLITPLYKETPSADGGKTVFIEGKDLPGMGSTVENAALLPDNKLSWIDVSNLKSFEEAGTKAAEGFDKILSQPLPKRWESLFGLKPAVPPGKEEALSRMAEILRGITENFRYFGDWRSVDGGYVPRPLAEVDQAGYGDCKDFAVMTTLAARYLGLTAEPVLVYRGANPMQKLTIPSLGVFNHAVTRVKVPGEDGWWWVDATNRLPQVGLIPLDLAGRAALSIGASPGRIEIPRDAADKSLQTVSIVLNPKTAPDIAYSVDVAMSGELGWTIQTQLFSKSPKQIEEFVIAFLGLSVSDAKDFKLAKMESSPDFPYTVSFRFDVTQANGVWRAGDLKILPLITFGDAHFRVMDAVANERGSDLMLDALRHITVTQKVTPGSYAEIAGAPVSCEIKSPWLNYSRKVAAAPDFVVTDEYHMRNYRVTLDEIKTPEFAKLQRELRDCLKGMRIVVK